MADRSNPAFLGRGWAFPPVLDHTFGQAGMVAAEDDIAQSLRILFHTRPGERVMRPNFGCRIHDYVFEPMNGTTRTQMEVAIRQAILFFEPRIILERVEVDFVAPKEGRLNVILAYDVIETNERHNRVFPFYIDEGTLLTGVSGPA